MVNEDKLSELSQILAMSTEHLQARENHRYGWLVASGLALLFFGFVLNRIDIHRGPTAADMIEMKAEINALEERVAIIENRMLSISLIRRHVSEHEKLLVIIVNDLKKVIERLDNVRVDK